MHSRYRVTRICRVWYIATRRIDVNRSKFRIIIIYHYLEPVGLKMHIN